MLNHTTQPVLLQKLFELLEAHRGVFRQERVYWRNVGMVLGELFNFGRRTVVTQMMMSLGVLDGDWSAWYRVFSRGRYEKERISRVILGEALQEVPGHELYVMGVDGVQISRSSLKMPGTGWLKAPRTPVFKKETFLTGLAHSAALNTQI
jgi:hypothetical protein